MRASSNMCRVPVSRDLTYLAAFIVKVGQCLYLCASLLDVVFRWKGRRIGEVVSEELPLAP